MYGAALGCLGDVTGDGYRDVGTGKYNHNGSDPFTGSISSVGMAGIYPGMATLPSYNDIPSMGTKILGNSVGDECGQGIRATGDIDNDGVDDFVVQCGNNNEGSRLFYGPIATGSHDIDDASARFDINGRNGSSNRAGSAGDVNADGYADFLIGSTGYYHYDVALFLGMEN